MKKFFTAVILAVFIFSAQIAFAADVDWNSVPRINSKAQLATYIENGRRSGQTEFNFVLTNFKLSNNKEIADKELDRLVNEYCYSFATAPSVNLVGVMGTGQLTYRILKEYPGTRVANAYFSREPHMAWKNLTNEEQKLYNIAVRIVDKANKLSSEKEKARYIHDEICKHVKRYESHTNEDAIGALIVGITNCQGFTDAFYMLGRMCGLNVRKIGGRLNKNDVHAWNWITFVDGKSYCVDVTVDDTNNSHEYFLATYETMKQNHECDWSIIPNLQ